MCSLSAEQFQPSHTSGRQQESMAIPKAADDGRKKPPETCRALIIINIHNVDIL
jgi:hypothetical protein